MLSDVQAAAGTRGGLSCRQPWQQQRPRECCSCRQRATITAAMTSPRTGHLTSPQTPPSLWLPWTRLVACGMQPLLLSAPYSQEIPDLLSRMKTFLEPCLFVCGANSAPHNLGVEK